jgi:hypothetical protein
MNIHWYKGYRIRDIGSTLTIDLWSSRHSEMRPIHHINCPTQYTSHLEGLNVCAEWIDEHRKERRISW